MVTFIYNHKIFYANSTNSTFEKYATIGQAFRRLQPLDNLRTGRELSDNAHS